jgi:hypothetical protein
MSSKRVKDAAILAVLLPLTAVALVVYLPYLAIHSVSNLCRGHWLRMRFQKKWGSQGKNILFVYSESPNWKDYIEREIIPKLSPYGVYLNYSRCAEWKHKNPLEAKIWKQWSGAREFNPMAIVIPDRGKVKTVRFYQAFRDYKHGKDNLLRQKEAELLSLVSQNERADDRPDS